MKTREVLRFLYWTIMPMAIGFVLYFYLDKIETSLLYKTLIFIAIVLPLATIRVFVGVRLFKEKPTLADKIISCKLRRTYGNDYCAECPDGYTCATDLNLEKVDGNVVV